MPYQKTIRVEAMADATVIDWHLKKLEEERGLEIIEKTGWQPVDEDSPGERAGTQKG